MEKSKSFTIRVLFYETDSCWVAQCLEHDIVAQGRTLFDAQDSFERALLTNIIVNIENNIKPLSQFKKAPKKFFDMFENSEWKAGKVIKGKAPEALKDIPSFAKIPAYQISDRRIANKRIVA